jgi:hypothetical protein
MNDRWRTVVTETTGSAGRVEIQATHGEYRVGWMEDGQPMHAAFRVEPGPAVLSVALVGP